MSQERQQREIRFRAFKDFGEFKVMLEDITVHATSGMIGLHDDHLKEELEKVGWTINDAYQFENIKTKETIDHDNYKCYDSGEEYFWIEDAQVMQFTGLKDKNGREIYEGDIIRAYQSDGSEVIHSISYSDSEARFIVSCVGYRSLSGGFDQKWIDEFGKEIIGNIYENP